MDEAGNCLKYFSGIVGIVSIISGVQNIPNHEKRQLEARIAWETNMGARIEYLDEQITLKQSELEHNRALVSQ